MKKVIAEVSARHLHLSQDHVNKLFGKEYSLKKLKDVSQPNQFATKETLEVIGPKNIFRKVRIVAPVRKQTQLELSISDCIHLGIKPVLKLSGDLKDVSFFYLKGPKRKIRVKGAIVPKRHLHISEAMAKKWKLKNNQKIEALIKGNRGGVLKEVIVRIGDFKTRLHLDTDEANAMNIKNNSSVYLNI